MGDVVQQKTGSPVLGTLAETAPDIVGALFGLNAVRSLKPGTALKVNGEPTKQLKDALNKHNIVYEQLSPDVQSSIPSVAPRNMLAMDTTPKVIEDALVKEIRAGGRQRGLAPYQETQRGKLGTDTAAQEAIRQQFPEGDVQMIKTSNPETQAKMLQMLRNREAISANTGLDIQLRPSNIVGDAAAERLKFIAQKAQTARSDLNTIAQTKLKGKAFDPKPIEDTFMSSMDSLGVGFNIVDGKPVFQFKGSIIEADRSAQRILKDLAGLMSGDAPVDALRAHNLKRQIDALVDWNKTPQRGLTASGQNVLKDVRYAINQSLRNADPQYARVNDVLSRSLQLFDELDSATASKITVAKTLSDSRGLGTELRKLFSNYQSRQDLDNAIRSMDALAKEFGTSPSREVGHYRPGAPTASTTPTFNDSIVDLARFANVLDERFGATAKTSFQGVTEQAVKHGMRAATMGPISAAGQAIGEEVMKRASSMRGVNDYSAYRSMEDLLKKGAK
jgi:hypothetical protein